MTDPKTRALSLIDELDSDRPALARALRLAITQIPTTSWQKPDVAPTDTELRILVEGAFRFVMDGRRHADGRWLDLEGAEIPASLRIIAWRPADSTELPEDWGTR